MIEFELRLRNRHGQRQMSRSIVGEFRPDDRGGDVFNLLQELRINGFDGDNSLRICEPVAYFPEWNLLLRSKASGTQLSRILAARDGSLEPHLRHAGRWLAKLHGTRVTHARRFNLRVEDLLNNWVKRLSQLCPSLTYNLHNVRNNISERIKDIRPQSSTLVHGDFHPKNIFVGEAHLTAIDFDHSCIFEPARDLGYFVAELFVQRALKKRRYDTASDATVMRQCFLSEYAPRLSGELLDRIALHEASSYLEHLNYCALMGEFDPFDFRHWLSEAEECLRRRELEPENSHVVDQPISRTI